jgi:hypothetical protein
MENVWIALVEAVFTFLGIWITVRSSQKKANRELLEKVDALVEHDNEQYLSILRLTIFAENMPVSERIIAGDKYIRKGGNGDTRKYYHQMLAEHTK